MFAAVTGILTGMGLCAAPAPDAYPRAVVA